MAHRVADRAASDKMLELLGKLRKKSWGQLGSIKKIKEVLDFLGGWNLEPFVGLAPVHMDKYPASFTDKAREPVEAVKSVADKHQVASLPTNPRIDEFYTMDVGDVREWPSGGMFDIRFRVWFGVAGYKCTSPEGKVFELLPSPSDMERALGFFNSSHIDLRSPKKIGKNTSKILRLYDIHRWLDKETKFLDQVNDRLGMDPHEKAKPRTRENTGSCPCCFRNIKLKESGSEHPTIVNHGFKRPGWGEIVGNCTGVGFPPFELSPAGTQHLASMLSKRLEGLRASEQKMKAGDVQSLYVGNERNLRHITPSDPDWDRQLKRKISDVAQDISFVVADLKVLHDLIADWKEQPLPEPGKETKVWK